MEEPDDHKHFLQIVEQADLEDRLMFATDYPHWDFDSPGQSVPRGISKEQRRKLLAGTAIDLYGFPTEVPARG
jgi:predicted TIM-barrel fold metal-dependent hydrolase